MLCVASDHAGFTLKSELMRSLSLLPWQDFGPGNDARVDYPDFADLVCRRVVKNATSAVEKPLLENSQLVQSCGILICGSGQGMAMRANRYPEIRAALCTTVESAELARQHNDANILCLPQRFISLAQAIEITNLFLNTPFSGGRHSARVKKLSLPACE